MVVSYFHLFTAYYIINHLYVSKRLNELFNGYKQFKDHRNLARTVTDTSKLIECFMNHFDKLIIRPCGQFTFNTMLYLRYSLESLKRQFCISNVLTHLFFCNTSSNSDEGNCRSCS